MKILLQQTALEFSVPNFPISKPGSVRSLIQFRGHGIDERVYGLGEHRTGVVNQFPYYKVFFMWYFYYIVFYCVLK